MMDVFALLGHGFAVAATPTNLFFCLVGTVCGTLIGVLPGLGPVATISLLLPATYALNPVTAIIMLSGIYYGAQYGGSTTAILVNIPGESTSVVTAIDGYKMAQQGRAGEALAIAAIGSFIAGCIGTLVIALLGPPLALMTQKFASPDYFSLMVLGLVSAVVLANGSAFRAIAMIFLGLLLGMVGMDLNTGEARMTFGLIELSDGINFVALVMGLFGVAEVISNLEDASVRIVNRTKIHSIWPSLKVLRGAWAAVMRGTLIGTIFGILPGGGATIASFSAYALEKRRADLVRTLADHGDSHQRHYGADGRRADPARHCARPHDHLAAARSVLGADREHVHWQCHARHHQSADDRDLGPAPRGALSHSLSDHRGDLRHRRVLGEQFELRRLYDGRLLLARLLAAQTRRGAGASADGLCAGPDDRGEFPAQHDHLAWRSDGVSAAPDQPGAAAGLGGAPDLDHDADDPPAPRRGGPGMSSEARATPRIRRRYDLEQT
jgi:TctA family transporter